MRLKVSFSTIVLISIFVGSSFFNGQLCFGQAGNVETHTITFTNGLQYQGQLFEAPKLETTWADLASGNTSMPLMIIDDGLRRICLNKRRDDVANSSVVDNPPEELSVYQHGIDRSGNTATTIGTIYDIGQFDEWGRRTITLGEANGPTTYTQGITTITPQYCELEVLRDNIANTPKKEWNMRISTNSVPVQILRRILLKQFNPKNFDDRLRLVEFFTQARRFRQARNEVVMIARDFPGLSNELSQQFKLMLQAEARQSLDEIRLWHASGNHQLAEDLMEFLKRQDQLSSETLAEINQIETARKEEMASLEENYDAVERLVNEINDSSDLPPNVGEMAKWLLDSVKEDLNEYTRNRLATFKRLQDDQSMTLEQKLALAISGWIIGSNQASDNLAVADSLIQAKPLVEQYLRSAPDERESILAQLAELEAGHPQYVSKIVELIKPPIEEDLSNAWGPEPLEIEFEVQGANGTVSYLVQLPPAYHPLRRYPCIVTLNGETSSPLGQISWWAGDFNERLKIRSGLAARNGYIVIAPNWRKKGQVQYEFSAREHAIVLGALRNAKRRFSIDTDRVFLTGHFTGGDAAWDIGLSHPDLWAGVIPISAHAKKYVDHYWKNAKTHLPFYFVYGERDYIARESNVTIWNRYLTYRDYNTFIVEFKGRGAEDFYEEVVNLYNWMDVQKRDFENVKSFECSSLRPTDSFFWWLEVHSLREDKMIHPDLWDLTKRKSDMPIECSVNGNKFSRPKGPDHSATIWLSPNLVDFNEKIQIGSRFNDAVQPSTRVLLEDVRRRGDRQHPFWAKIEMIDKRWQVPDEQ